MERHGQAVVVSHPAPVLGRDNYSYSFVVQQFRPLLARWGPTREVNQPESRVEFSLRRFRQAGLEPLHLGFSPLHVAYLARQARNAAFVFWEYPDLLQRQTEDDLRYDWARMAKRFDRLFTASTFTQEAFWRAGVRTPIDVIPVPVAPRWFELPLWQANQSVRLEVPAFVYPLPPDTPNIALPYAHRDRSWRGRVKAFYRRRLLPLLPEALQQRLRRTMRLLFGQPIPQIAGVETPVPRQAGLELSGVVYLHLCNPYDERKNWQDLVAAFLEALGDCPDATLVIKLVAEGSLLPHAINAVNTFYLAVAREHCCRIALVGGYLSDEQMSELIRASTYYATATRAEGANLPLMDALAAGRPALSPRHTSMRDYFTADMGWVVPSTDEPAAVTVGRERLLSRWQRVDFAALVNQFRASYELVRRSPDRYSALARAARQRMHEYASLERVWPIFRAALEAAVGGAQ
ncbi:MAG: glycosyltransferase [Gemmataceae bacterium]|nr:glycosyltransferase [Gemmata sp.]MDW8199236.1 glycosyltransferase [Gemmataceae bacterium]